MIENHKTKYYIFWVITILLVLLYLLDRSQVKKRINDYELDIARIEKKLISNKVLVENINDSQNYFESIMQLVN